MRHILMVCAANVCRSPMAQIVATQISQQNGMSHRVQFESAGTHASRIKMRIDSRAVLALERRNYKVKKIRSRAVENKDFQRFDWILAMDNSNYCELQRICPPELQYKLKMFLAASQLTTAGEVPDPYYGNNEGFERVLDLCEAGVNGLLSSILV